MRRLSLYKTIIKLRLKDYKALGAMILFPIILTVLFIQVFSNLENGPKINEKVSVYGAQDVLVEQYIAILEEVENQQSNMTLEITRTDNREEANVVIDLEANEVVVRDAGFDQVFVAILEQMTTSFSNHIELGGVEGSPYTMTKIEVDHPPMWMTVGITMIIFVGLLGGQYGITQVVELKKPTGIRLLNTTLSKKSIYLTYIVASISLLFIQLFIVCASYQFIFNINLWRRMDLLIIILGLMSIMSITMGSMIGLWVKDEGLAAGVLSSVVTLSCMLSGGLVPNVEMPMARFNPFTRVIHALLEIVQTGQVEKFEQVCLILIGLTVLFSSGIAIKLKERKVKIR